MTLLIGIPTYDEHVHARLMMALLAEARREDAPPHAILEKASSALTATFNYLWCMALNNRPAVTHFLMIHADVVPFEPGFLRSLLDELERTGAGLLSALLPIKDEKGLTSTAFLDDLALADQPLGDRPRPFTRRRLTVREAEQLPETFGAPDLARLFGAKAERPAILANTGLMLVDMRQSWVDGMLFDIGNRLFCDEQGRYAVDFDPEDWRFSLEAQRRGARVLVTRKVKAFHAGQMKFPNWGAWGEWKRDKEGTR